MSTSPEKLLTVDDVAEIINFSRKGVYGLVQARRIPFVRVGNRIRFRQEDVSQWVEENRVPALEKDQ